MCTCPMFFVCAVTLQLPSTTGYSLAHFEIIGAFTDESVTSNS